MKTAKNLICGFISLLLILAVIVPSVFVVTRQANFSTMIVEFDTQVDLSPAYRIADRQLRGQWVVSTLTAIANEHHNRLEAAGFANAQCYLVASLCSVTISQLQTESVLQVADVVAVRPPKTFELPPMPGETFAANNIVPQQASWPLELIRVPPVWNLGFDGTGIVVSSIDSGVERTHPELAGNYGGRFFDGTASPPQETTPYDDNGHGTYTMALIAGQSGLQIGTAPGVTWIAAKGCTATAGCQEPHLLAAADWILQRQPHVVNNSWGGLEVTGFQTLIDAWLAADIWPVGSAGNWGVRGCGPDWVVFPADYQPVEAVGAVDQNGNIWFHSSRGPAFNNQPYPDISAPGHLVTSAWLGGTYHTDSGTSAAGPFVTGVIALLRQADPSLDFDTAKSYIHRTALRKSDDQCGSWVGPDGPGDNVYGYGILNALAAVFQIPGVGKDLFLPLILKNH